MRTGNQDLLVQIYPATKAVCGRGFGNPLTTDDTENFLTGQFDLFNLEPTVCDLMRGFGFVGGCFESSENMILVKDSIQPNLKKYVSVINLLCWCVIFGG